MLIDLARDRPAVAALRLFEARGIAFYGDRNPSVFVLLHAGADEDAAIQEAYSRLRLTRGLNMERVALPFALDGAEA